MSKPLIPYKLTSDKKGGWELRVSHSSMNTLNSCGRRFEFGKLYHHPRSDMGIPPMVGKALHAGYQEYLLKHDEEAAIMAYMMEFDLTIPPKDNEPRTLEAGYATLMALIHSNRGMLEYEIATIVHKGVTKPAIEVPFRINLNYEIIPGVPVVYIGFIDIILFNMLEQMYKVVDIKSHRRNFNDMTSVYMWDTQCIPYALVLESVLGQTISKLDVTYLSAYVDIEKPAIRPYEFTKFPEDVQDWARLLFINLENLKTFINLEWFPRNPGSCTSFNTVCQYFDICKTRDTKTIQTMILSGQDSALDRDDKFDPWLEIDLDLAA